MSNLSNNHGRGYEYACIKELYNAISSIRPVEIIENSSLEASKRAYNVLSVQEKEVYGRSAQAMIPAILECEPYIVEKSKETLFLYLQQDEEGEKGDVRDIIITNTKLKWEIGLSIKHNHFAVKHSRLSPTIDFGEKWFGVPCSQNYWNQVMPVFDYLEKAQRQNKRFKDLPNKDSVIYKTIMNSFIAEIKQQYLKHKDLPQKMVEYLLGKYDFYKIISIDKQQLTQIQAYNLHKTLNQSTKNQKPTIIIPVAALPNRIISIDFMPNHNNTVELYMDNGWFFTFRIHNAETYVKTSLKFDIQIKGMPTEIIIINCVWK